MPHPSRRSFLTTLGMGAACVGLGPIIAHELGADPARLAEDGDLLHFGDLEGLVALMRETPLPRFQSVMVAQLGKGVSLDRLVAAGALANARTFGGEDYEGFHAFFALVPSLNLASQLPKSKAPLPVLKVLYRNAQRIQGVGGVTKASLRTVEPSTEVPTEQQLRELVRARDTDGAERGFAALVGLGPKGAYDALQPALRDEFDVHRVALAWRVWDLNRLTGLEHAHALMRQSVRFFLDEAVTRQKRGRAESPARREIPRILEKHGLLGAAFGTKSGDDAWVLDLAKTIFSSPPAEAADAVAASLAQGYSHDAVREAMALVGSWLVLHDPGRTEPSSHGRYVGSVHGASLGVHGADSLNAWGNIARVVGQNHRAASLVAAAWQEGGRGQGHKRLAFENPDLTRGETDPARLLEHLDAALVQRDQTATCAWVHRALELGHPEKPLWDAFREVAVDADGALHAEKFWHTIQESWTWTRPALRRDHLLALARVSASEHGAKAPGLAEARRLI